MQRHCVVKLYFTVPKRPEAPGRSVWENSMRDSWRSDLGCQGFLLTYTRKRYTRTCDPSHSARQPLPKRLWRVATVATDQGNQPVALLVHYLLQQHWRCQGNSSWQLEWYLGVRCLRRHVALWHHQCNRAAKKAVQHSTVNHGVCPNMSSERPACLISDNMMVLTCADRPYSDLSESVSCLFFLVPYSWPSLNFIEHSFVYFLWTFKL